MVSMAVYVGGSEQDLYEKRDGRGGRGYIDTVGRNRRVQCPWLQFATGSRARNSEGVGIKLGLWELSRVV
jgi:hypothetical protein